MFCHQVVVSAWVVLPDSSPGLSDPKTGIPVFLGSGAVCWVCVACCSLAAPCSFLLLHAAPHLLKPRCSLDLGRVLGIDWLLPWKVQIRAWLQIGI